MFYFSNSSYPYSLSGAPVTVSDVNTLLSTFKPRALGEIPNQAGFCFPYGFIGDNGKPEYEIKNSFRFTDQPNVAYSFYTGDINLYTKPSIARQGILNAAPPRLVQPEHFTVNTIKKDLILTNGNTLTLTGWSINEKQPVNPQNPRHYYLVYGQLQGDLNKDHKTYLGIQINAFDRNEKDGRPSYAPPLEVAIKRLEPLLNSLQLAKYND